MLVAYVKKLVLEANYAYFINNYYRMNYLMQCYRDKATKFTRCIHMAILLIMLYPLTACSSNETPSHPISLREITSHNALSDLLVHTCQHQIQQRASLYIMFSPPQPLWENNVYQCANSAVFPFSAQRPKISLPRGVFSSEDEQWLLQAYRLYQYKTYSHMSEWIHPTHPQDISFLHRGFAKYPYISARLMASSPAPHVGEVWQNLYRHMDNALLNSNASEDKRLLAYAMIRDNRTRNAIALIEDLLMQGDAISLQLLPYLALDLPQAINDEMAETSEPELGYQVVAMLENYLYRQQYPRSFCTWATQLAPSSLADYVKTIMLNLEENFSCQETKQH